MPGFRSSAKENFNQIIPPETRLVISIVLDLADWTSDIGLAVVYGDNAELGLGHLLIVAAAVATLSSLGTIYLKIIKLKCRLENFS